MNGFPRTTHLIVALLRRKLPHIAAWDRQATLRWVQWFCDHGLALVVRDGYKIHSAVLFRRISATNEAEEPFMHESSGKIAYIEVCACRENNGMKPLFAFLRRYTQGCDVMCWCRSKFKNRPFTLNMEDAERRFAYE